MIHFVLLISRQGKVRLTKWYSPYTQKERSKVLRELSGVILNRGPKLCNFVEWHGLKVVYKDDNELETLEIIHHFVEILDRYFGNVIKDMKSVITGKLVHDSSPMGPAVSITVVDFQSALQALGGYHTLLIVMIFVLLQAYYILDEVLIAGELQESSKKSVARVIAAQDTLVENAKEEAGSISNMIAQVTK